MANPFRQRATEYLRDDESFLAVVTPEPLVTFFEEPAREERLYDRLAMIIGTPGSGKTTLARLFELPTITTLLRNRNNPNYNPLLDKLTACGAISNGRPILVGGRLPLEAEYREFHEFPYSDGLKTGLMIALLQARTLLTWLRHIQSQETSLDQIEIVPRAGADAALGAIGGKAGPDLRDRALEVELAIYRVSAALVPPRVEDIDEEAVTAYRPFDVIEGFRVGDSGEVLRPLVIFDDAHSLHPDQFAALTRRLARRELKVSRWILTRLDALTAGAVLENALTDPNESGFNRSREVTEIWMQNGGGRATQRREFRKMAKAMGGRYMSQMDVFSRRRLRSLGDLLSTEPVPISASNRRRLARRVDAVQRRHSVTAMRRTELEQTTANYVDKSSDDSKDLRLGILSILLERYAKRVPQPSLFGADADDPKPTRPLKVDANVAEGARIHLLHKYNRPHYFGIDALCDASSENAEQFLQLTAQLVSQSETQLIRSRKGPMLESRIQHRLLRRRATEMMREWDFPQSRLVRRLTRGMALQCLTKSLEGNAPLGCGASAFGIPQDEFDRIPRQSPELAAVLKFGVAYNAFALVPRHGTKNRLWCLIQLGGVLLLHYGLTLRRGGFLERCTDDLINLLEEK